jgi:hypothetical protein
MDPTTRTRAPNMSTIVHFTTLTTAAPATTTTVTGLGTTGHTG